MGIALEHLSPDERRAIAERLFTVTKHDQAKGELHGHCPLPGHEDQKPSFSYNYIKDQYNCLSGCGGGDLAGLWTKVTGRDFRAFCQEHNIPLEDSGSGPNRPKSGASGAKAKRSGSKPKPEKIIPESEYEGLGLLPEKWIARLQERRGWSPEVIERLGIRLGRSADRKENRICIPLRDGQGRLLNIRQYSPGAKEYKILPWTIVKDKKKTHFGTNRLFPDPSAWQEGTVWLCEGEPDTICALSRGLNAVTQTAGAGSWNKDFTRHFKGRDVVICYDADKPGAEGALKTARAIAREAKLVRVIEWPELMSEGQDLTDWFVAHGKSVGDLKSLLGTAKVIEAPRESDDNGLRRFFAPGISGGKRLQFKSSLLADEIMAEHEILTDPETELTYRFEGAIYEPFPAGSIRKLALQKLGIERTMARANDAASQVVDLARLPDGEVMNPDQDLLCLKNGMFNLVTGEVQGHGKVHRATYRLPIQFDPRTPGDDPAIRCERWLEFLEGAVEKREQIAELQEFFGYCLIRSTAYDCCLILVGPRASGKSTALKVLKMLVGAENTAAVDMAHLEDQFHRASLFGKVLNVSDEIEGVFRSEYIKKIISGGIINAAFKYKDVFEFEPFCKMAFAANRLPRVLDTSDGFYEKLLIIRFPHRHAPEDRDPELFRKLSGELTGIFAWAWMGLRRLRERGHFKYTETSLKTLDEYRHENNPVLAFIEAECTTVPAAGKTEAVEPKADMYKAYKEFCAEDGYRIMNNNVFARELREAMRQKGQPISDKKVMADTSRVNAWVGIRLGRPPAPPRG